MATERPVPLEKFVIFHHIFFDNCKKRYMFAHCQLEPQFIGFIHICEIFEKCGRMRYTANRKAQTILQSSEPHIKRQFYSLLLRSNNATVKRHSKSLQYFSLPSIKSSSKKRFCDKMALHSTFIFPCANVQIKI